MTAAASKARTALWLLGDARCERSPSPILHNALFATEGGTDDGDSRYVVHVDDDAARAFAAAEGVCRGVNVTAPHKIAAARRYQDVADDRARTSGAVNTVVYDDDGRATVASNTDVHGLLVAWRRAGLIVEGRTVAVIGAGGAARAVVVACAEAGARDLVGTARRKEAAASLVALAATVKLDAAVTSAVKAPLVVVAAADLDDVGAWLDRTLLPGGVVHELRYGERSWATRHAALSRKALFVDGSSMLLAQAEESAALFQGRALDDGQRKRMSVALASWLKRPGVLRP